MKTKCLLSIQYGWVLFQYYCLSSLLIACAAVPKSTVSVDPDMRWQRHRQQISAIQEWTVSGRMALKGESKGVQGGFRWQQRRAGYSIRLTDPFGRTQAVFDADAGGARLTRRGEATRQAADANSLLRQYTDQPVPVMALGYWLRGIPLPKQRYQVELDEQGTVFTMVQAGWTLRYTDYRKIKDRWLPTRISARNEVLELRFVLSDWQWGS
jgi:outer membrane lipoprotein LolB